MKPHMGEIWKNKDGQSFLILGVEEHTDTKELLVGYRTLFGSCGYYAKPFEKFMEECSPFIRQ